MLKLKWTKLIVKENPNTSGTSPYHNSVFLICLTFVKKEPMWTFVTGLYRDDERGWQE